MLNLNAQFNFITGPAGTGKTTLIKNQIENNPSFGVVCATTGIAAVNLSSITINSLLKYFDTESLIDSYINGWLKKALMTSVVEEGLNNLIIDEVSMMDAAQLDVIMKAVKDLRFQGTDIGITLTGDFCQLPPVDKDATWAFNAECWPEFAENITRLSKIWRQSDASFLYALSAARQGLAREAVAGLKEAGVEFSFLLNNNFDGTTLMGSNEKANAFNEAALLKLKTPKMFLKNFRYGLLRPEWTHIPETLELKEGALVMLLSNDTKDWMYANGDLAYVVGMVDNRLRVRVKRNNHVVDLGRITRNFETREEPEAKEYNGLKVMVNPQTGRYIIGYVNYYPIRLAYATTVHKSQGLTLDNVQVDIREWMFTKPQITYVALSRARTPKGLRIVGSAEQLERRIKIYEEVKPWI